MKVNGNVEFIWLIFVYWNDIIYWRNWLFCYEFRRLIGVVFYVDVCIVLLLVFLGLVFCNMGFNVGKLSMFKVIVVYL